MHVSILWKFIFRPETRLDFDETHEKASELGYKMFIFNGSVYPTSPPKLDVTKSKLFDLSEVGME